MTAMDFTITLSSGDGQEFAFPCTSDETLTMAAERAGLSVPSVCGQGCCGACQGTCDDGDYLLGDHSAQALPESTKDHGGILLCRTTPKSDLRVRISAPAVQLTAGPVPRRPCRVVALTPIGGAVMHLVLDIIPDPEEGIGPLFEPGQFMELQIPGTETWRAYSLANAPNWDGRLEFLIRLQPDGQFSRWLQEDAKEGMVLETRGAQGSFGLRQGSLNERIFIAGGTGLAPFLSILHQAVDFGDDVPTQIIFGVTSAEDLFAVETLKALTAALPSLRVDLCLWKAPAGWGGVSGTPADRLADLLKEYALGGRDGASMDLYVCGPAPLIDAVEMVASTAGIPTGQVVAERFLPPV